MTYARARLWLGISGVGFFVVASATALWFDLPQRALAGSSTIAALSLTLAIYILVSFPADFLGGYFLPRRYQRTMQTFASFLGSWARGVSAQGLIMGLCAFVLLRAARAGGTLLAIGAFLLLMLVLLAGQLAIASMVGSLKRSSLPAPVTSKGKQKPLKTLVYQSTDSAFVGGVVGFPGRETLVLPAGWIEGLPKDTVAMQVTRRDGAIATGARTRGIALALIWNLAGFALASQAPHANAATVPGLISLALWFTLWSFVGLLLLPSLNRPGVHECDRFALNQGFTLAIMTRGITALDRLQDDEPVRARWIERVFHPIPSVSSRTEALKSQTGTRGAWQGARVTLYLSWAGLSLLSRAVHCNVGRPELWVMYPGD